MFVTWGEVRVLNAVRHYTPGLEGNRIAYIGRRFWIAEITEGGGFQGFKREGCGEYSVYDRLYGGVTAVIKRIGDEYEITTTTYLEMVRRAPTLKECARVLHFMIEEEMRLLVR